jgi:hypothetical protein
MLLALLPTGVHAADRSWESAYKSAIKSGKFYGYYIDLVDLNLDGTPEVLMGTQPGSGLFSSIGTILSYQNGTVAKISVDDECLGATVTMADMEIPRYALYKNKTTGEYKLESGLLMRAGAGYYTTSLRELSLVDNQFSATYKLGISVAGNTTTYYVGSTAVSKSRFLSALNSRNDGWEAVSGFNYVSQYYSSKPSGAKLTTLFAQYADYNVGNTISGTCGSNLTWTLKDGALTITGTGAMTDYTQVDAPWKSYADEIKTVIIGSSVTSIGNSAFANCSSMTSVTIPDTVTQIGVSAFYSCTSLREVTMPDSVKTIGASAFAGCSSLKTMKLSSSLTSIPMWALSSCGFTSITLPDSITEIGDFAFNGCKNLTSITIPDSVKTIGYAAFAYCENLSGVTLPEGLVTLSDRAFSECPNLAGIAVPKSVTEIDTLSLGNYESVPISGFTIYGYSGTTAESYASEQGFTFVELEDHIAAGHTLNRLNIHVTTAATSTETGLAQFYCKLCGMAVSEVIPTNTYPDLVLTGSSYYYVPALWAAQAGLVNGMDNGCFAANTLCSRSMIVTILWRAAGEPEPESLVSPFDDVADSTSWYYKAVLWAAEQGITTGYDDGLFDPNGTCTRAMMVTFIWRASGSPDPASTTNPFVDVVSQNSSSWYYDAVIWAVESGMVDGVDSSHYAPNQLCTRGNLVTILYRAMN